MPTTMLDRPSYDEDFHAWALDQAERLRAFAQDRSNEPIDWQLLAEEVEDMGKRDLRTAESFLGHILVHLLEIDYARDPTPIRHWIGELRTFRRHLRRALSPSLHKRLQDELADRYAEAVEDAEGAMHTDPTFLDRVPRACPYSWDQITGDWLPERAHGA